MTVSPFTRHTIEPGPNSPGSPARPGSGRGNPRIASDILSGTIRSKGREAMLWSAPQDLPAAREWNW